MIEFAPHLSSLKNAPELEQHSNTSEQRLSCLICGYCIELNDRLSLITFFCNVRAFKEEVFQVWRCPDCSTIHCLNVVDLKHYYNDYPFAQAKLSNQLKLCYKNLYQQLVKHGLSYTDSILDYGCGSGLFVKYLRQQGFSKCYGYDPHACQEEFGNSAILRKGPFNYILLQDVIEHVEDPHVLLSELDALLAPGGYILIGTPNAANIDLSQPHISDYYNSVHVPYHLHIYTRQSIEYLARQQGWIGVDFSDRPYHDTRWFGTNSRAWNEYQRCLDGTINTVFEPIKIGKELLSYRLIFYSLFGYWLSLKTEMSLMFRKTGV
ncbi:class I SAM-dependent methyltransferase [Oscillatoria sp. FACHB-1407]|uniref:class I SAM-dependent methyltransferase n=1 Tax=Oscillatoria sp. FACHB-1407 TaxID=2692847 RepID=UPI0016887AAA|nr:class I SAM-dependent methyltransferase [Oscillatoria sp. FACHB-1407]MBD2464421.1 class I SAM-dependent methyltransferase [Oscillatoria sp. FACHB-1407]